MRLKKQALALLAPAVLLAGCVRGEAVQHAAPTTSAASAAAGLAASSTDARKDICDVYGFAVSQVNTAQAGFETVSGPSWNYEDGTVTWNLSVLTTQLDDYARQVGALLVDPLPPVLREPLAAWADKSGAWKKDVPDDLRAPLASWVDAAAAWKAAYWNHANREDINAASAKYDQVKAQSNKACGI